ncbi:MAG: FAD-dependent oxidoreductase, partial [Spirochaetales bacterium]|nr:FAD-dependent oxidoreductase [Spirochaetales bacterium]
MTKSIEKYVTEPSKKVPVAYDVDVVIAGAGIAGVFAAIASARGGADTVLIDRFGSPGGNMGPGMIVGAGFHEKQKQDKNYNLGSGVYGDLAGIPREFVERYAEFGGAILPYKDHLYVRDSNIASQVSLEMLKESGVKLLLSSYAADPIIEGSTLTGLFFESKSGRQAVKAKVTIDATGEADLARRAGVPVLKPKKSYNEVDQHSPNGMGIWAMFGGIDCERYEREVKEPVKIEERDLGR